MMQPPLFQWHYSLAHWLDHELDYRESSPGEGFTIVRWRGEVVDHFEASSQSDAERIFLERTDLHHFYDDDVIAEWKSLYEEGFLSIGNPLSAHSSSEPAQV